jgi:hypothetical protein
MNEHGSSQPHKTRRGAPSRVAPRLYAHACREGNPLNGYQATAVACRSRQLPSCTPSNRTDARAWSPGTAPSSAHKSEAAGRRSWPSAPAFLECNLPLSALPAENPLAWRTLGEKRLAADAVEPHPDMLPVTRTRTGGEKLFRGRGGVMDASLKNRGGLRRAALSIQRTPTALPAKTATCRPGGLVTYRRGLDPPE